MRPCVKQHPQQILTSSCLKGGLGRSPLRHKTTQIKNDQVGYLYTKHRALA
jgi:hypothetical protein